MKENIGTDRDVVVVYDGVFCVFHLLTTKGNSLRFDIWNITVHFGIFCTCDINSSRNEKTVNKFLT